MILRTGTALALLASASSAQSLLPADDVDRDGIPDVFVSTDIPGQELFVLSAANGTVLRRIPAPPHCRGTAQPDHHPRIARAADADHDGRPDLAIAWTKQTPGHSERSILLTLQSTTKRAWLTSTMFDCGENSGCELEAVGDTNGDGVDDVVLAVRGRMQLGREIYVCSGDDLRTLRSWRDDTVDTTVIRELRALGDVDDDGCADFSTGIEWRWFSGAFRDRLTSVIVRSGSDGLPILRPLHREDAVSESTAPLLTSGTKPHGSPDPASERARFAFVNLDFGQRIELLSGDARTGTFEHREAYMGDDETVFSLGGLHAARSFPDFDGDGRGDIAFAIPELSRENDREVGCLRILSAEGRLLAEWFGDTPFARFGTNFLAAGDTDRDGVEDVWVIALPTLSTPEVILISGATGRVRHRTRVSTW